MNKTMIGAALVALLASPALAQNQNANQVPAPSNKPAVTSTTASGATAMQPGQMHGIVMGKTASAPVRYGQAEAGDLMTSKLVGVNVYNNQNEKIGEISDLIIDNGKTLSGVILSVGGFLGVGEKYVLVEPSSIALHDDNGAWKAFVNTNKDNLKSAPTFTYKDSKKS